MNKVKNNLIKVREVYFDTKTGQPVLKLENGTTRVIHLVATGNCWVEYWVTPEQRKQSEEDAKKQEAEWQAEAKERMEQREKKKWWWQS